MPDPARLRRLIAAYEQRRSAGRPVDEDDILRSYPDLAEGFRRYVERRAKAKPEDVRGCEPAFSIEDALADPPPADLLAAGTRIDRYRIIEVLGSGAMGTVYKAEDERLGRAVAIKIPDVRGRNREMFLQRFEREARLAAVLSHPSLCPILDFGTCDVGNCKQQPYLTMPVLPGPSLAQFVEIEGAQSPVDVVQLVRPIVEGLCEMHEHGVTHRDLKPSNVLLDRRGRPVITDFGLARRDTLSSDVRLTNAAALLGSPAYCSPEQIRGDADIGPPSDLYSLGVLMYELLTGRLPFEGSVGEVLGAVLHVSPPPPSQLRPSLAPSMEELCLALLHKDAAGRPQSADEVLKRLDDPSLISDPLSGNVWIRTWRRVWTRRKTSLAAASGLLAGTVLIAAGVRHLPAGPTQLVGHVGSPTPASPHRTPPSPPPRWRSGVPAPAPDPAAPSSATDAEPPPADVPMPDELRFEAVGTEAVPLSPTPPFVWQQTSVSPVEPLWDAEFVRVPPHLDAPDDVPPPDLLVDASSWLNATGKQDLTHWVPSPPQSDWQLASDTARLQHPQPLLDPPRRSTDSPGSSAAGRALWYPRPLGEFEFECELTLAVGVRAELVFLSLAPSPSLSQEAVRVALTGDTRKRRVLHLAGTLQQDRIRVRLDDQPEIELDLKSLRAQRPVDNWHAQRRALPTRGYFGIQIRGDAAELAQVRVQPLAQAATPEIAEPRLVRSLQSSMRGPLLPLGEREWLQTDPATLTHLLDQSFATRLCLQDESRNHHWSARELVQSVASGRATDFTLLGTCTDGERTRTLFLGPDFVVAAPLEGPDKSLQLLAVPHWNEMTQAIPLSPARLLGVQLPDRSPKAQVYIWHVPAEQNPYILATATVPTRMDSLTATPDGTRIVYTKSSRLYELNYQPPAADALAMPAVFEQPSVQRIPWQVALTALSADGQRLALVAHLTNIWTAKLVIMQRREQHWEITSEAPLAEVFWDEPPARTQRRFAGQKIKPHSLEWSPDGTRLLGTFSRAWASSSQDGVGVAMVWSDFGTKPLLRMSDVRLPAARFDEDSQHMMLVHNDGVARLWQLPKP